MFYLKMHMNVVCVCTCICVHSLHGQNKEFCSVLFCSKWACTFDNNGCANYFFMEGKMLKKVLILTCPDQKLIC